MDISHIDYIREVTDNVMRAKAHLDRNRHVDIACVYCVAFYRFFPGSLPTTVAGGTMVCTECGVDGMIPVTSGTCLYYSLEGTGRMDIVRALHEKWFTPIEYSDDEDDGGDDGGDEWGDEWGDDDYYEETKDSLATE